MNEKLECPHAFDGAIGHHVKQFAEGYTTHERSRGYAFDHDKEHWLQCAALSAGIDANRDGRPFAVVLRETLTRMADLPQYGSNILKPPLPEIPKTPQAPIDPSTGAPLLNPYAEKDEAKKLRLLADLRTNRPDLDQHFKAMHERPFSYLAGLEKERAAIEHERKIIADYGSTMNFANGWRTQDVQQQAAIEKNDPVAARIFKKEAVPARIGLTNQTRLGQLVRQHPQTAAIVTKAIEVLRQWQAEIKAAEAQERVQKRAQAIAMRNLLGEEQRRPISPRAQLQPTK
jgi:hypothetical protein